MSTTLGANAQIYLFFAIAALSYFLAGAMDGVMGDDGFGVLGNQMIIMAGFYLGLLIAKHYHFPLRDFAHVAVAGLIGAFVSLLVLGISKSLLARL